MGTKDIFTYISLGFQTPGEEVFDVFGPQKHTIQTPFTSGGTWKARVWFKSLMVNVGKYIIHGSDGILILRDSASYLW